MNSQNLHQDKGNLESRNNVGSNSSCSMQRSEEDVEGKVKTRLMSMWNNMKYGWTVKLKTNFSKESPVWLLGRCYHKKCENENSTELGTDVAFAQSQGQVRFSNLGHLYFVPNLLVSLFVYRFPMMKMKLRALRDLNKTLLVDCGLRIGENFLF